VLVSGAGFEINFFGQALGFWIGHQGPVQGFDEFGPTNGGHELNEAIEAWLNLDTT